MSKHLDPKSEILFKEIFDFGAYSVKSFLDKAASLQETRKAKELVPKIGSKWSFAISPKSRFLNNIKPTFLICK